MSLAEYNKKRSFDKTPEPHGRKKKERKGKRALRFVVQKHDASHLHYDFRLELDGVLKSWAIPKGPSMNPGDKRLAMMTEDHPLSYASFEGTIPKGHYGAGEVIVWDRGVYTSAEAEDPKEAERALQRGLSRGDLKIVLLGEKLKGSFALVRMKDEDPKSWLLIKKEDAYASDTDVAGQVECVLTGSTLSRDVTHSERSKKKHGRTKKAPMPRRVKPMLAKLVDEPFKREGWLFEIKWDGYRAIAEVENDAVSLYSRNGNKFDYPSIVSALRNIPHECVLDGEVIALKDGKVSFQALQYYKEHPVPLQYAVFDLLYLDGVDLRNEPLTERKRQLAELVPPDSPIILSEHIDTDGVSFYRAIKERGLEGVMAKEGASPYREGTRSDEWLKIKIKKSQEAIIVGFTEPRGSRKHIGALVLAAYKGGKLTYIGHSGGGFTDMELEDLYRMLSKVATPRSPLKEEVPVNSPITWVRPKYICEVSFTEWTKDGRMRHPIYKGLRTDKELKSITKEEVVEEPNRNRKAAQPALTNTDKIFWPEERYTKGDLLAFYEEMAPLILPYLRDRPQNLNRHPNGIDGKSFYQKNFKQTLPPFVTTKEIWSESNSAFLRYIVCQNVETLLYLVNLGCIELNPWHSRIDSLEFPDYMVLDLDPHGRPFEDLIRVAREVRAVLALACDEYYLKTSGKTGLHIVLPLGARYGYDAIRMFAELIMQMVHKAVPDITSIERDPRKRKGKIYLDYLQNRFGQTLASVYSVRPYPGATVSTPLEWSELRKGFTPSRFTIKTMGRRIRERGDLWQPVLGKGVDIARAIDRLRKEWRPHR